MIEKPAPASPSSFKILKRRRLVSWAILVVMILAAVIISWQSYRAPRGSGLRDTLPGLLQEIPNKDEQRIGKIILDSYIEYRGNARNWSAAYFGCLFFSAAFSALAGFILKLQILPSMDALKKDLSALLAMLAALLITLATVGGFHQRWVANRMAAAKMEKLAYAFMAADRRTKLELFLTQIQTISYERNEGIFGSGSERENFQTPKSK